MPTFRKRKHPNRWMEGQTEGQSDPILKDPSDYCRGSKKTAPTEIFEKWKLETLKLALIVQV